MRRTVRGALAHAPRAVRCLHPRPSPNPRSTHPHPNPTLTRIQVRWLTRFNPYDGSPISTDEVSVAIPNGLGDGCPANCAPDLRQPGDWYIGVQALDGSEAEFELNTTLVEPPHIDRGYQCDPSAPECRAPLDLAALSSAARPRAGRRWGEGRGGGESPWALVLLTLGAGAAVLVPATAVESRRVTPHESPQASRRA